MLLITALALVVTTVFSACPFFGEHDVGKLFDTDCADLVDVKGLRKNKQVDPDPGQGTVMGCQCDSECGATPDFGGSNCDWCYTKNGCGKWAYTRLRYYDYCVYPTKDETSSWQYKQSSTWNQVSAENSHGSFPNIAGLFAESIQTSFDNRWDFMPAGRLKYIHSMGAVCQMEMKINSDKYTGIFQRGSAEGLLRMGPANDYTQTALYKFTPGMGFKFFRTGQESANWVSLYTLDGQDSYNFFYNNQSNHIPGTSNPAIYALQAKFEQGSGCAQQVGLSHAARWSQDGFEVSQPVFPFQITFEPTESVTGIFPDTYYSIDRLFEYFQRILPGTTVWNVYAKDGPSASDELIGSITTLSGCVESSYGDSKLFFRHQRVEEDWQEMASRGVDWLNTQDLQAACTHSSVSITPPANCSYEKY